MKGRGLLVVVPVASHCCNTGGRSSYLFNGRFAVNFEPLLGLGISFEKASTGASELLHDLSDDLHFLRSRCGCMILILIVGDDDPEAPVALVVP